MNRDYSNVSPAWGLITYYYPILSQAHVGIVGNERADRLAAAAARRAHRNCVLSASEREERRLESLADALVASLLAAE